MLDVGLKGGGVLYFLLNIYILFPPPDVCLWQHFLGGHCTHSHCCTYVHMAVLLTGAGGTQRIISDEEHWNGRDIGTSDMGQKRAKIGII
jgi:hypothetical protein